MAGSAGPLEGTQITGLILAGGAGRRMDGADKGLMLLNGRPLVEYVLERLTPQVGSILISANRHLDRYAAFGWPVISDALPDFQGPLAGLAAGLSSCVTPWLVCVPCDAPALPTDLVDRLSEALKVNDAPIAVACAASRRQPTFLLCQRGLAASLQEFLAAGGRKIGRWLHEHAAVEVDFANAGAFANLNTPGELAAFQSAIAKL